MSDTKEDLVGSAETIREYLFYMADQKYQEFQSGLVPGNDLIIGVRIPVLRKYAKELLKSCKAAELLQIIADVYYEEVLLQGMVIGLQPKPEWEVVVKQIQGFVPKIDNWAVCDIFCGGLKITKQYKEEMFAVLEPYISSEAEFERRFGIVMLLSYYMEEEWLDKLFFIFERVSLEGYYVQMAVAWAVSICLVKFYQRTLVYLSGCGLDDFTYNKALQKATESYRITKEQKEHLRSLKRVKKRKE